MQQPVADAGLSQFGPIEGIVLLGGGRLLRQLCLWAASVGLPVRVVTAPRHAAETVDGEPLSAFLEKSGVDHLVVEKITDEAVPAFLGDAGNIFYLSLGAAWIFRPSTLSALFGDRLFNLHGTRLPQNRGGGGFSWQIMMGNRFGFCVLHRVDGGVDTGDLIAVEEFLYPATARKPVDFENVYIEKNFRFVQDFILAHRHGPRPLGPIRQSEYFSTYWPRLNSGINGWIDWAMEAAEIEKFICAFDDPYPGARTMLDDRPVRLKSVCLSPQDGAFHSYQSGIVYRKGKHWLCVALKGSTLVVEGVFDEEGTDLLDSIRVGDRFVTPAAALETARQRPVYSPKGLV